MSSSSKNTSAFAIPPFDGSKERWLLWRERIKAAMTGRGWWKYVEKDPDSNASASSQLSEEESSAAASALSALILALPDELLAAYGVDASNAAVVWKKLCTHFESASLVNQAHLRSKLMNHRMTSGMTYLQYYTEMMSIVRSLKGMGVNVDDADVLHHLLHGLAPEFGMVKLLLLTSKNTDLMNAHEMLSQHADRLSFENPPDSEVFFAGRGNAHGSGSGAGGNRFQRGGNEARNGACFSCGSFEHRAFDCPKNAGKKKCNFCRHVGSHVESECRKKKAAALNGGTQQRVPAAAAASSSRQNSDASRKTLCVLNDESEEEVFMLSATGNLDLEPDQQEEKATAATETVLHAVDSEHFSRAAASKKAPASPDAIRLVLDSAATIATCNNLAQLTHVRSVSPIRVKTANNTVVQLHLAGTLRVRTPDGSKTMVFRDVYYWPECPVNLISVGSLTRDTNKEVVFAATEAIVRRADQQGKEPILRIPKRGSLYVVDLCVVMQPPHGAEDPHNETASGQGELAMPVLSDAAANVLRWHYRTGHIGKRSLADLAQSNAVRGLEQLSMPATRMDAIFSSHPQCHGCAVGKATRKAFTRHNSGVPASEILDVMHADVKGPINVPSASGKRYVLCLTDEKSRRTWGFLMKHKSESAALIQALVTQLQVETGKLLRVFHADNGGEFITLVPWFESRGIRWDPTTPGTPNHNSIAERAWRTIFNATRAMLHHAGLPLSLWGHAVQTAILLKNKTLTSTNGALTPEVIWQQQAWALAHPHALIPPPVFVTDMKNLRVFGCNAYIHLQDRKALDARAARGVFLGYADESKGYYFVFNVETKKLIRSRDVRFDEDEFSFAREIHGAQLKGQLLSQPAAASREPVPAPGVDVPQRAHAAAPDPKPLHEAKPAADIDVSNAEESPAAAAQGEHGYASDGAAAADDEAAESDADVAAPAAAPAAAPPGVATFHNVRGSPPKAKVIFDDVRSSNIVQERRARSQVNYKDTVRAKPAVKPGAQVHALYVVQPADDAAAADAADPESDSHDEVEDPEPDFTPNTWRQAMSCKNAAHWMRAAEDEIRGMQLSNSYMLVPRPTGPNSNVIDSKWVWKKKLDHFGRVKRFRARLVARGFKQIEGVDFFETFAPVMRYKSLLILLAWAAAHDYEVRHLDVPKAFLQAMLDEDIFMEQPEGCHNGDQNWVWKLLRSVYGIRQAPNNWNHELNRFLLSLGFQRLKSDPCIYVKQCHGSARQIVLGVFVDDIIPVFDRTDEATEWQPVLRALQAKYQIVDTGDATLVLGIRLTRDRASRSLRLDHAPYIAKMLKDFQMEQCNPVSTPSGSYAISKADCPAEVDVQLRALYQRMVGSLNYAAISVRPDIAFAVNTLARYLQQPGDAHLTAAKRVLRYLRHTADMGIVLGGQKEERDASTSITVWSDADWATNPDNRRSITGYVIQVDGAIVSWHSKQQSVVAKSTCEAEMYALSAAVSEAKWIRMFVRELIGQQQAQAPVIHTVAYVDNTAAIAVSKNDVHHSRTKHIDLRHHHVREAVEKNLLRLEHVPSAEQLADILTKPLAKLAFERLRDQLMSRGE